MQSKKINVFLGGYLNITNAQNLNCLALAKHLDKEKFNGYSLELYSGNLKSQKGKIEGLTIYKCLYPAKISMYLGFLWGIWKCDIAYLPKGELWRWNRFWLKVLRKKSFSTIEGILDDDNMKSAIEALGGYANVIKSYSSVDRLFPISKYLGEYNNIKHGLRINHPPLYLGCETALFKNQVKRNGYLKKVIYIGRLKKRKGVYDFIDVAKNFPRIEFYIYGNGEEEKNIEKLIHEEEISNLSLMGTVSHQKLAEKLSQIDLHILPSRSEGFPKVTLETAAAGVPSLVYCDYGANEWITHNHNGFVVETLDQMTEVINRLIGDPELLQTTSHNSIELAKQFDWKALIKNWEIEILKLIDKG
jgi:glycosyltransferase involved in cell wall biosynthesis